ncbi:hypothetical protein [uncultured Photobacterium sp.]|uniref:hypothetical protein n=1 Tax=uncultured Photobacterium sp. TaxID=173973 RepID=UPI0026071701|nr:hypothetical protein [uncultured Photobacterium sp.]
MNPLTPYPTSQQPASQPSPIPHTSGSGQYTPQYPQPSSSPVQQPSMPDSPPQEVSIRHHSFKVHGGKAALDVRPTEKVRKADEGVVDQHGKRNEYHTIQLESAPKLQGQTRAFDWQRKVSIQLTQEELPLFIAVCLGLMQKVKFGNHGVGEDKGAKYFSVENQGLKVFVQIGCNSQNNKMNLALPVTLPSAIHIGNLALAQYCKNFEGLTSETVLQSIRYIANVYCNNNFASIEDRIPS